MRIRGKDGKMVIEKTPYNQDAESIERYNEKYGVDGWRWAVMICSYVSPECGYGDPLDERTCRYCNGKCMRPKYKITPIM